MGLEIKLPETIYDEVMYKVHLSSHVFRIPRYDISRTLHSLVCLHHDNRELSWTGKYRFYHKEGEFHFKPKLGRFYCRYYLFSNNSALT